MQFNTAKYGIFLVVVFLLFWTLVRYRLLRLLFLLGVSYYFYANWNPTFLLLIWFSSSLDFVLGAALHQTEKRWRRRLLLAASLTTNLGILAIFKYADFFLDSAYGLLAMLNIEAEPLHLNLILPVGISFYTFKTMSYIIDIYRGQLTPTPSYLEYLLFVSFFPQLVAGPIVRASQLIPQFARRHDLDDREGAHGFWLIMIGLLKKVVIADYLGSTLVDLVFTDPIRYTSWEALAAIYAYALEIYCDFSGYSDVAIGSALLLGFKIPINFDEPYKARNLRDFWRRWHISLSFWFRDYLYISLGGNRKSRLRTYFNLWVTMVLCGLWHGAEWKFVLWGCIHGVGSSATRLWQDRTGKSRAATRWGRALAWFLTFQFVCFAWVFFRADNLDYALAVIARVFAFIGHAPQLTPMVLAVMIGGYAMHWLPGRWEEALRARYEQCPAPVQGLILFAVVVLLYTVAGRESRPFIYYQF